MCSRDPVDNLSGSIGIVDDTAERFPAFTRPMQDKAREPSHLDGRWLTRVDAYLLGHHLLIRGHTRDQYSDRKSRRDRDRRVCLSPECAASSSQRLATRRHCDRWRQALQIAGFSRNLRERRRSPGL